MSVTERWVKSCSRNEEAGGHRRRIYPKSEKKRATLYRTAFPDVRLTIEDIISEGETVTARWSCQGTHKGDLNGIAPTGNGRIIAK
jgi:predicted ester cyclase